MGGHLLSMNLSQGLAAHALDRAYNRKFSIIRATTDDLREEVFRIRYKVFCIENAFENPAEFPDQLEHDAYDRHACHVLLKDRDTDQAIGTIRLIRPNPEHLHKTFPMQAVCKHELLQTPTSIQKVCEVSRLCVSREFRRRQYDGTVTPGLNLKEFYRNHSLGTTLTRRLIPYSPLGLFKEAFSWALDLGAINCVAVMEPHLIRSMKKIGFRCAKLGDTVEFHGTRQPIIFNIKQMYDRLIHQKSVLEPFMTDHGKLHLKALHLSENLWEDTMLATDLNDVPAGVLVVPPPVGLTVNATL